MSDLFSQFPCPPQLLADLKRAGVDLTGDAGAAYRRYELALGRLAFLTLAAAHDPDTVGASPELAGTPQQIRAMAEGAMTYLQSLLQTAPAKGVDEPVETVHGVE